MSTALLFAPIGQGVAQSVPWLDQTSVAKVGQETSVTTLDYTLLDAYTLSTLGEQALRAGLFERAAEIFAILQNRNAANPWGAYGQALAFGQLGQEEAAFHALGNLHTRPDHWGIAAAHWRGEIVLQLAERTLLAQENSRAKSWLNIFAQDHPFHVNQSRYQRLLTQWQDTAVAGAKSVDQAFFRVGVLLPTHGTYAALGGDLLRAMQLALFREQAQGILLYPADSGDTPESAVAGLQKLLNLGVDIVVGPLLSPQVAAIASMARANRMPLVTLSSNSQIAGPQTYAFSYLPQAQTQQVVQAAMAQGKTRFAALVPDTPYGQDVLTAFQTAVTAAGGQISAISLFDPANADLSPALESLLQLDQAREQLAEERTALETIYAELADAMPDEDLARMRALKDAEPTAIVDFDALFMPVDAEQLPLVASQLAFYDVDAQDVLLLGTSLWNDPRVLANRAEYLTNSLFTAPGNAEDFIAAYTDAYGQPPHPLALLGYDAVMLAQSVAWEHRRTRERVDALLRRPAGFAGLAGPYRLEENGLVTRAYTLKRITRRALEELRPAPILLPPELPVPLMPTATTAPQSHPQKRAQPVQTIEKRSWNPFW